MIDPLFPWVLFVLASVASGEELVQERTTVLNEEDAFLLQNFPQCLYRYAIPAGRYTAYEFTDHDYLSWSDIQRTILVYHADQGGSRDYAYARHLPECLRTYISTSGGMLLGDSDTVAMPQLFDWVRRFIFYKNGDRGLRRQKSVTTTTVEKKEIVKKQPIEVAHVAQPVVTTSGGTVTKTTTTETMMVPTTKQVVELPPTAPRAIERTYVEKRPAIIETSHVLHKESERLAGNVVSGENRPGYRKTVTRETVEGAQYVEKRPAAPRAIETTYVEKRPAIIETSHVIHRESERLAGNVVSVENRPGYRKTVTRERVERAQTPAAVPMHDHPPIIFPAYPPPPLPPQLNFFMIPYPVPQSPPPIGHMAPPPPQVMCMDRLEEAPPVNKIVSTAVQSPLHPPQPPPPPPQPRSRAITKVVTNVVEPPPKAIVKKKVEVARPVVVDVEKKVEVARPVVMQKKVEVARPVVVEKIVHRPPDPIGYTKKTMTTETVVEHEVPQYESYPTDMTYRTDEYLDVRPTNRIITKTVEQHPEVYNHAVYPTGERVITREPGYSTVRYDPGRTRTVTTIEDEGGYPAYDPLHNPSYSKTFKEQTYMDGKGNRRVVASSYDFPQEELIGGGGRVGVTRYGGDNLTKTIIKETVSYGDGGGFSGGGYDNAYRDGGGFSGGGYGYDNVYGGGGHYYTTGTGDGGGTTIRRRTGGGFDSEGTTSYTTRGSGLGSGGTTYTTNGGLGSGGTTYTTNGGLGSGETTYTNNGGLDSGGTTYANNGGLDSGRTTYTTTGGLIPGGTTYTTTGGLGSGGTTYTNNGGLGSGETTYHINGGLGSGGTTFTNNGGLGSGETTYITNGGLGSGGITYTTTGGLDSGGARYRTISSRGESGFDSVTGRTVYRTSGSGRGSGTTNRSFSSG